MINRILLAGRKNLRCAHATPDGVFRLDGRPPHSCNGPMNSKSFYISRRRFLKTSAAVAAASGLPHWFIDREMAEAAPAPKPLGPNDKPGIALVGCGGQGTGDCGAAKRFGNVVAVCDVDDQHAETDAKKFTVEGKAPPEKYNDFRKVME